MRADCESVQLDDGSLQEDVWGADWYSLLNESPMNRLSIFVRVT
jgi:hypothetical protein